jgi:hypothetical protein
MASSRRNWSGPLGRVLATGFGGYIALTSLVLTFLGVEGGNGWLAILYGGLGVSTGLAGVVGVLSSRPLRSLLMGWFLVGMTARTVLDGGLYLGLVGVPVMILLVAALVVEVSKGRSVVNAMWTAGGGAAAVIALVLLAVVAPDLPAVCPARPALGQSVVLVSYPFYGWPWDAAEQKFIEACL